MGNVILRTNATPIYGFLSLINARLPEGTAKRGKILDCGAGGPVPPLALFHQHGFDGWGIDTSDEQLDRARRFCEEEGIGLHLRKGDMRSMPFGDQAFDYVYEHYSMCHLSKVDTARSRYTRFSRTRRKTSSSRAGRSCQRRSTSGTCISTSC